MRPDPGGISLWLKNFLAQSWKPHMRRDEGVQDQTFFPSYSSLCFTVESFQFSFLQLFIFFFFSCGYSQGCVQKKMSCNSRLSGVKYWDIGMFCVCSWNQKRMTLVSEETACFSPLCLFCPSLEGGWVGWRDDTEEICTTHGQLPHLIHLPYRHFLSFSTLTKLLVRGGGRQRIYIQKEWRMDLWGIQRHLARARDGHKQIHRQEQCSLWHTSSQW